MGDVFYNQAHSEAVWLVYPTYNLPRVRDLAALAVLAELVARVQTATGS